MCRLKSSIILLGTLQSTAYTIVGLITSYDVCIMMQSNAVNLKLKRPARKLELFKNSGNYPRIVQNSIRTGGKSSRYKRFRVN